MFLMIIDKRKEAQDIAESLFDPIRVKIQKETLDLEKQLTMLHQVRKKGEKSRTIHLILLDSYEN